MPRWVVAAGSKPILKNGVICLAYLDNTGDKPDRISVPRAIRIPLIRTLAKLRARYIWGIMAGDVIRVIKTCLQCWSNVKDRSKKAPLNMLPKGWPGEVVAMDLFGPLPRTTRVPHAAPRSLR